MKAGTVCVDLAAAAGGNIATTMPDQKVVTPNGVTCLGYTDLNSRLATTSSSLYANNQALGPHTCRRRFPAGASRLTEGFCCAAQVDPLGWTNDDKDEGRIRARSRGCRRPRNDGRGERGRDVALDTAGATAAAAKA